MFIALDVSLEVIRALRPIVAALRAKDPGLAVQLTEAANSAALNIAEGNKRVGKDRAHHFRIAAGSCAESRTCVALGSAWGHLEGLPLADAEALMDRQAALFFRLVRRG